MCSGKIFTVFIFDTERMAFHAQVSVGGGFLAVGKARPALAFNQVFSVEQFGNQQYAGAVAIAAIGLPVWHTRVFSYHFADFWDKKRCKDLGRYPPLSTV
ncbi:MAG: hypothetical protein JNL02_16210 [Saprospiraceae bacterium]|nr:hypothetical protein [Saprospiraceae bacterium]